MDPITLALLGVGVGTSLYNIYDKKRTEKDNQELTKQLYQQSRADALDDFNRTNEYNSPRQQMIRLREAGLNPNLVYGSGVNMPAAKIDTPEQERYDRTPTPLDLASVTGPMGEYARIRNINANTDNLAVQNEVLEQEKLVKGATLGKIMEETASTKFQRENAQMFQDTLFRKANLENQLLDENIKGAKVSQEIGAENIKTQQLTREKITQDIISSKLQNSKTQLEKQQLQENLRLLQKDNTLKQIEIDLKKAGIMPNTKTYERVIIEALNDPNKAIDYGGEFVKKILKRIAATQWGYDY